ncbi:MAG TPA: FtsX-like permease family protein, partial [Kineosporiaceae bacterium]|nr:FtsX-like permease family protein [Kineosporiaceae bacterium]
PPTGVPVAVSEGLAAAANLRRGSGFALTVGTTPVAARVADVVPDVPSVPGGPAVLADVDILSRALLAAGDTSTAADGWWVGNVVRPDAAARVRALGLGTVVDRTETVQQLTAGPLRIAEPVALAGLAPLAVVLALAGAGLAVSADLEARAVELARLRALGLRRADLRRGLLAQHVGVLGLLVLAGVAVAAVGVRVLGPLLVRSDTGGEPVPAVRPVWPWPLEAVLIGVLLFGVAGVVAAVVVRRVRRADAAWLRVGAS